MTRRDRKAGRRAAHAARTDNRRPDYPLTADQRRIAARDARRKARKETTA